MKSFAFLMSGTAATADLVQIYRTTTCTEQRYAGRLLLLPRFVGLLQSRLWTFLLCLALFQALFTCWRSLGLWPGAYILMSTDNER
jgi:hypothetical protein